MGREHNSLVLLRNLAEEGWSGVEVQLKRRHDLADTLVNSVRGYMTHERAVLEEVTRCRAAALNAAGVSDAAVAENMLSAPRPWAAFRRLWRVIPRSGPASR